MSKKSTFKTPLNMTGIDETRENYRLTNLATFQYYLNRIFNLYLTRFTIKNLPKYMPADIIERTMLERGGTAWFVDDVTKQLMALPFVYTTGFDPYGVPSGWDIYGKNGYYAKGNPSNSVIMWDNYNRLPVLRDLAMFAKRLEIIERTMDVNIQGQKTPYILRGTKQQIQQLRQLYEEMEAFAPATVIDSSLDLESVASLPTQTPFIADSLQIIKRNIFNECMTFLGILNANSEKKERMVDEEATGNQGMILNQLYGFLKPRQEAIEKINEMFAEYLPDGPLEIVPTTLDESEDLGYDDTGLPEIEGEVHQDDSIQL